MRIVDRHNVAVTVGDLGVAFIVIGGLVSVNGFEDVAVSVVDDLRTIIHSFDARAIIVVHAIAAADL